jgi:tRNA pseudouridine38-40 synthase
MEISYDGTGYKGFQLQPRVPTVQGVLEKSLTHFLRVDRQFLAVQAASRTDAGVHARQQYVEFFSPRELDERKFVECVNRALPDDVAVASVHPVADREFNVRFLAQGGKVYTYDVHTARAKDCFLCRYRMHFPEPLDLRSMLSASKLFVGEHDFRLLSASWDGSGQASSLRRVYDVDVIRLDDTAIRCVVHGQGFLHKQVRHMVGVLLAVGAGTMTDADVDALLRADDDEVRRRQLKAAYKVAEGKGLTLQRVLTSRDEY